VTPTGGAEPPTGAIALRVIEAMAFTVTVGITGTAVYLWWRLGRIKVGPLTADAA
jgi:hypothetical protein